MDKSAEQILTFSNSFTAEAPSPLCTPEDLAPLPRELSFGVYLRRERILRGISREEVVRVTKVSPKYLEHLEANRFELLPPRAFIVGFLRVFSGYAGLNADEVVNRYLTELAQKEAFEESTSRKKSFWKRHFRALLGIGAGLSLLALLFAPLLLRK